MIRTRVMPLLILALLAALPALAAAETLTMNGTLSGDPLPDGYNFELATLAIHADGIVVEVVGKSCSSSIDGVMSCQRATEVFSLPEGLAADAKKVYYKGGNHNLYIGDVVGIGNVHWVRLRKGAALEATTKVARLKLNTELLSRQGRAELFEKLFPRP